MTSDLYEHTYASSSSLLGYMFDNKCQTRVDCPINEKANLSPTFEVKIHTFFPNEFTLELYSMIEIIHH